MKYLFYGCSSLISLPNILKWNTDNTGYMGNMFEKCSSLISLPNISKWNTNKLNEYFSRNMFDDCFSLLSNFKTEEKNNKCIIKLN